MSFTEAALAGEWLYLEGEQPLTPDMPIWTFENGSLLVDGAESGRYAIGAGEVVIVLASHGRVRRHEVRLVPVGDDPLTANTTDVAAGTQLWFDEVGDDDEPVRSYGSLIRKVAADKMLAAIAGQEPDAG